MAPAPDDQTTGAQSVQMTEGVLTVRRNSRADDHGNLCLGPSSICLVVWDQTIAHRVNMRQMANKEMENLSRGRSGPANAAARIEDASSWRRCKDWRQHSLHAAVLHKRIAYKRRIARHPRAPE
jgi:hypothetical protein